MKIYSIDVFTKIPVAVFIDDDATDEDICIAALKEAKNSYDIELSDIEKMTIYDVDREKFFAALENMRGSKP